jgi:hypothetical protein
MGKYEINHEHASELITWDHKHYGKTADCRASNCLPCAFCRAHGKRCFFRAFFGRRTSNKNARYPYTLSCVFEGAHGNHKSLSCVFLGTHGNSSTLTFGRWELTGVKLCRAPWKNARQRQQVCRAFSYGARQSYSIAVHFTLPHGNVFLKIEFSHLISIFSS